MAKPSGLEIQLPPGFRFHPSDEELIVHYLRNKVTSSPLPGSFIAEIDLYKYNPWDLPKKALFGEEEWFFFTPRDRKYPNGARPNRAAGSGYWKATGTDKPILTSGMKSIGVKKALVFYQGRPPKGSKTDWIMHEYRLLESIVRNSKRKGSMRLDDWVLCQVRQKNSSPTSHFEDGKEAEDEPVISSEKQMGDLPSAAIRNHNMELVKSYLYNEFPMLPYIFASLNLPPDVNLAPSTSFQCSDDKMPSSSCYEDNTDIMEKLTSTTTGTESSCNPLKRKHREETQEEEEEEEGKEKEPRTVAAKAALRKGDSGKEEVHTPSGTAELEFHCSAADKCGDYNFTEFDHWNFTTEYDQEFNNFEFPKSM